MKINTKHFSVVLATLLSFSGCGGGEGGSSVPFSNNLNSNLQTQYEQGFPSVAIIGDKKNKFRPVFIELRFTNSMCV